MIFVQAIWLWFVYFCWLLFFALLSNGLYILGFTHNRLPLAQQGEREDQNLGGSLLIRHQQGQVLAVSGPKNELLEIQAWHFSSPLCCLMSLEISYLRVVRSKYSIEPRTSFHLRRCWSAETIRESIHHRAMLVCWNVMNTIVSNLVRVFTYWMESCADASVSNFWFTSKFQKLCS